MRRFLFLYICLLAGFAGFGQSRFQGGLMTGLNFARILDLGDEASATARPFIGAFGQYHFNKFLSFETNAAFSLRGMRFDQRTDRLESEFIDSHFLVKARFLESFSFGMGVGYYHALEARWVNVNSSDSRWERRIENPKELSQFVVPVELGFQFQNEATLHFTYGFSTNAQYNNPAITFRFPIVPYRGEPRPSRRAIARNQADQLHNGMLLVRLHTSLPLIEALKQQGKEQRAAQIRQAAEQNNREIVSAFKTQYTFSPVFFFHSNHSKAIAEGDFSSLLDAEFKPVTIDGKNDSVPYFIAEFTHLKPDTGRFYSDSYLDLNPGGGQHLEKRHTSYNIGASFMALVVKDRNFVQLRDPFPYYVRSYKKTLQKHPETLLFLFPLGPSLNVDHEITVRKLDRKLHRFSNRGKKKE